jgi:hypothetical protein
MNEHKPQPNPRQPLSPGVYAVLSAFGLLVALAVGWYLLANPNLLKANNAAARAYYPLLIFLGLGAAAFLFGAMRSTATISGTHFGAAFEFGGPAALAILVVIGGFWLTKTADSFNLTVRLRSQEAITDATETWARIDLGARRDERLFSRDGEVTFSDLPARYLEDELPIVLISKGFRLKEPKPTYKIPADAVLYLDVAKTAPTEFKIEISSRVTVSHIIGDPIVAFGLRALNETTKSFELSEISLDLTSPKGAKHSLILSVITAAARSGDMSFPPPSWRIAPGEALSIYLWWARIPWQNLTMAQAQQIKQLPEYQRPDRWPCNNELSLSDDAAKLMTESLESAFIWEAGLWTFELTGVSNGKSISLSWGIQFSDADINGMKAVSSLYKSCQGLSTGTMFVSIGAVQTMLDKPRLGVTSGGATTAN